MKMITTKLKMRRICLILITLLSSVFTFENAFSLRYWEKRNMVVIYNKVDKSITIECLIYDQLFKKDKYCFLFWEVFSYSENGMEYSPLIEASARYDKQLDRAWIHLFNKKHGEKIQILSSHMPNSSKFLVENKAFDTEVGFVNTSNLKGSEWVKTKRSYLTFKWFLNSSIKSINSIKLNAMWKAEDGHIDYIDDVYPVYNIQSNSNTLLNAPSLEKNEISNEVVVSKDSDAIIVTGAEHGENIKVYTTTGAEVKSVVANNDVVNIELPKNQLYLVKAGPAVYKVAL